MVTEVAKQIAKHSVSPSAPGTPASPRDDMTTVRVVAQAEFAQVTRFYQEVGYNGVFTEHDLVVVAQQGDRIAGALRLCREAGTMVLRGVRVLTSLQRQGIGSRLLVGAVPYLSEENCYCLPHGHLKRFYGTIGFEELDPAAAPGFLVKRLEKYTTMGLSTIIMLRKSSEMH